jgi:hypothetical protein
MLQLFMFILQIRVPYRPVDAKLSTLTESRDKLPSGKQTLALTLTSVTVLLPHIHGISTLIIIQSFFFVVLQLQV